MTNPKFWTHLDFMYYLCVFIHSFIAFTVHSFIHIHHHHHHHHDTLKCINIARNNTNFELKTDSLTSHYFLRSKLPIVRLSMETIVHSHSNHHKLRLAMRPFALTNWRLAIISAKIRKWSENSVCVWFLRLSSSIVMISIVKVYDYAATL